MICLSIPAFLYFMAVTGLGFELRGPVVIVYSDNPLAYVKRGPWMCTRGAAV